MSQLNLHVAIGPVQTFVGQARRTRDLWAGSFLLSWLTGQLMSRILRAGGEIVFPRVGTLERPEDPLLAAILGKPLESSALDIGSLPNRFEARVPGSLDPNTAVAATLAEWYDLCERVWDRYVAPVAELGNDTRIIWKRQIDGFWEPLWVLGDSLNARKNWRTRWPVIEGGDHCSVMGDRQELSGYLRATQKTKQDEFWEELRRKIGRLDLRDGERLCAISLVKRLFPKIKDRLFPNSVLESSPDFRWPSTADMAALTWLVRIARDREIRPLLESYHHKVKELVDDRTFKLLTGGHAEGFPALKPVREFASLDGNLFLSSALSNPKATPLTDRPAKNSDLEDPDSKIRRQLLKTLEELELKAGGAAHPYFALLLMDGDRLGKLLQQTNPERISQALSFFVQKTQPIVTKHNGRIVYAGGDDVLAMLPLSGAIDCAIELRHAYGEAFRTLEGIENEATASCAVVFSHYHNPLRDILKTAHRELDETAKDGNGRNSLALALMQPGGVKCRWAGRFGGPPETLRKLQYRMAEPDNHRTSFLYHLQHRYGEWLSACAPEERRAVALAEYAKGREPNPAKRERESEEFVDLLLAACREPRGDDAPESEATFRLGGAFLTRFLAERSYVPTESNDGPDTL